MGAISNAQGTFIRILNYFITINVKTGSASGSEHLSDRRIDWISGHRASQIPDILPCRILILMIPNISPNIQVVEPGYLADYSTKNQISGQVQYKPDIWVAGNPARPFAKFDIRPDSDTYTVMSD